MKIVLKGILVKYMIRIKSDTVISWVYSTFIGQFLFDFIIWYEKIALLIGT